MTGSWARLPTGRVVSLADVPPDAVTLLLDPLPADAPAVITYFAKSAHSVIEMVSSVLAELETAALRLFPAWLPEAEGITGPQGAGAGAVRALALRVGATTHHFGHFLADLAERALERAGARALERAGTAPAGTARRTAGFASEVRAAGLARVLAASYGRERAAILVQVPGGLSPVAEEVLVAGCEWLAHRGGFGVWLTGAPLLATDRVEAVPVRLPAELTDLLRTARAAPAPPEPPALRYPPVAGRPHPGSAAEQALEAALAPHAWAEGREWNQTHRPHPLANPVRVDLLWRRERCVVEIDGPEHREPLRFAADRQRDVHLQLRGYAVLRFTNDQVLTDVTTVVRQLERFLRGRRLGTLEG